MVSSLFTVYANYELTILQASFCQGGENWLVLDTPFVVLHVSCGSDKTSRILTANKNVSTHFVPKNMQSSLFSGLSSVSIPLRLQKASLSSTTEQPVA